MVLSAEKLKSIAFKMLHGQILLTGNILPLKVLFLHVTGMTKSVGNFKHWKKGWWLFYSPWHIYWMNTSNPETLFFVGYQFIVCKLSCAIKKNHFAYSFVAIYTLEIGVLGAPINSTQEPFIYQRFLQK